MILMNEVIKLGGEAKDKIKTAAIATAMRKDIIATHALAAAYYTAATVGESTKSVAIVEKKVQDEVTGRGEGVNVEEEAIRDIFGGGHAPSQPTTPMWGTGESLGRWGRNESKVKITMGNQTQEGVYKNYEGIRTAMNKGNHTQSTEVYEGTAVQQSILRGPYETPTRLQSVKRGSYEKSARGMLYEHIYTEEGNVEKEVDNAAAVKYVQKQAKGGRVKSTEPTEGEYIKYAEGDRVQTMVPAEVEHKKYTVGNSVKTDDNEGEKSQPELWGQEGGTVIEKPKGEETFCVVPETSIHTVGVEVHHIDTDIAVYDVQWGGGESGNIDGVEDTPENEEDSVVDDQDEKYRSWSLDTEEENPNNCGMCQIVGVQNDMDEKSHPNSLELDENPDQCGKSHLEGEQNEMDEKCHLNSLKKEDGVDDGEKSPIVFMDYNTVHNNPVKENQLKDTVEKNPNKLNDAIKDINNPARLRDALKENQMKDSADNTEGGHALKSLPPEVKGGALHGADVWGGHALLGARPGVGRAQGVGLPLHEDGGEASQMESTSFEVLPRVEGGHALLGARPDVGHQGVSLPHHTDGGHNPTDDARAEEQFASMNAYENAAVELYYAKSARVENDEKTYRNTKLPRHSALMPSRCPEDSMGGDIVEGPVVFPSRASPRGTEAGVRSRQASAQGFIWVRALMGRSRIF